MTLWTSCWLSSGSLPCSHLLPEGPEGWAAGGALLCRLPDLLLPQEDLFVVLQYLPPGVIALVNFLGPLLFVFLVQLENYPPSTEVNLTLIW